MAKQIVCIGDSNTWGYDPRGFGGGRYPAAVRWTARLDSQPEWVIHNLGENGREIPHSAFALRLLGQQLEALAPLDGICLMLGSNDLLCGASPAAVAARMEDLLDRLGAYGAPLLLIAPPPFCPGTWVAEEGADRRVRAARRAVPHTRAGQGDCLRGRRRMGHTARVRRRALHGRGTQAVRRASAGGICASIWRIKKGRGQRSVPCLVCYGSAAMCHR